jgi:biopolymer transport protein ExbD
MAEMDTSGGGGHKKGPGVKKSKKLSTRVDLTPMVDLGFLLITFFIFTTTMSAPTAMKLFLPKDTEKPEEQNKIKESGALTIMLSKNNTIYYYEGTLDPQGKNFQSTNFKQIRDVIINKKRSTKPEDFVVVIKPGPESTYKNTVDILDEMTINEVKRYAMVDLFPIEQQLITATEGGGPMPAAPPAGGAAPAAPAAPAAQ